MDETILNEIERMVIEAEKLSGPIDPKNIHENIELQAQLWEQVKELGRDLPEGLQIGKYLEFQVADGEALYLIDQIEEQRVHCRLIPLLDAYESDAVDSAGWCLRSIAEEQIDFRELQEYRQRRRQGG